MSQSNLATQLATTIGALKPPYIAADVQAIAGAALYAGGFDADALIEIAFGTNGTFPNATETLINGGAAVSAYDVRPTAYAYDNVTGEITLVEKGFYLVIGALSFGINATGQRCLYLNTNTSGAYVREAAAEIPATTGSFFTQVQIQKIMIANAGDKLKFTAVQGSGGTLQLNGGGISNGTWCQVWKIGTR